MAKRSQPRSKWTAAEVKVQIKRVQEAVDKFKRDHKAEHMTFMSADDVVRKLKRVNSPMIVFQSWNSAAPGGTVSYSLGIYNPDPTLAIWMFAHVWFGSGNVDPVTGTFLAQRRRALSPADPAGFRRAEPGAGSIGNAQLLDQDPGLGRKDELPRQ